MWEGGARLSVKWSDRFCAKNLSSRFVLASMQSVPLCADARRSALVSIYTYIYTPRYTIVSTNCKQRRSGIYIGIGDA